ncbi:CHAT domain-containing protein [Dactylosporangium sucinum]|uniref:CHAT domain-containing protein n=1 Tax=Dactylosporangium sucinum TaxID=1424081 RepID=A0A917TVU4_9ACTN|nr:CHAT domain-containing protein [Dactylosporangium sucinum]GGM40516.1 CHAT domain-containing protein [Dactylosporangium sucinum]
MSETVREAAELLVRARSEPGADDALLRRSIALFRAAKAAADTEPGALAANLGVALRMLAERTGEPDVAAEAVAELRCALDVRATSGRYLNLASALHVRFLVTGDDAHLGAAVDAARAAVDTCDDDLLRPARLASLAGLLLDRAGRSGDRGDVDEALALTGRAFELPTPEDDFWSVVAGNRVLALRMAYERAGDPEVAEEAIDIGRETLRHLPAGSAGRASTAGNLGLTLLSRYRAGRDARDLRAAVEALTVAADHPGPLRHLWLSNLVTALTDGYRDAPDEATFALITAAGRAALDALGEDDPRRGPLLVNLGGAHLERYERTGDPGALDEAERLHRAGVEATADAPVHRTLAYGGLAVVWQRRAAATGDTGLLDRAVELGRELVDAPYADPADRANALSTLGLALADRFVATGSVEAVAEAAARLRDAVEALPPGHADRLQHLSNLTVLLQSWAEATGEQRVTDEAIAAAREAVTASGDLPVRVGYLANLGGALWRRYVRTGDPAALGEAVEAARAAVTATPPDHPDRPMYLSNLSGMLARQDDSARDPAAMREAVACAREAVERTAAGHPDRPMRLSNLGLVLRYHWEHHGEPGALDAAVEAAREAVATTPAGHHALPGRMSNLAATLLVRHGAADRAEAARLFHDVARSEVAPVPLRVQTAARAGELAAGAGEWTLAAEEFGLAVRLMPRLATHYTDRADEEHELARFAQVPGDAAACALHAGNARLALDLLEVGTGVMLARTLELRTDLTELRERFPDLAVRLQQVAGAIGADGPVASGVAAATLEGIRRRGIDRAWRDLVAEIRRLPGLDRFQLPPSEADLRALAAPGPIAVVSTSRYRCDALLVTADGQVRPVPLPGLAHDDVVAAAGTVLAAGPDDDPAPLRDLLAWLWDTTAEPVLAALPAGGPAQRLWWMPVGVLSLLPLHAAGHPGGPYVDDRVVAGYTPTLGALRHHRARPVPADLTAVVVGAPDTAVPLPGAAAEAARVAALLGARGTALPGDAADTARVLPALHAHGWVHFSGHATADLDQPSRSHLLLADGPLSVADLAARRLDGQVAVLSACSSNRTRADLAAEAVHIAAAFHLAGFGQVVGTLWPVADRVSLRFADRLYRGVVDGDRLRPERLAGAVRDAVRHLRARWPDRPGVWAPYVHLGR